MLPRYAIVEFTLALANGVFIMKWKGLEIMRHKNDYSAGAIENSSYVRSGSTMALQHITETALLSSI